MKSEQVLRNYGTEALAQLEKLAADDTYDKGTVKDLKNELTYLVKSDELSKLPYQIRVINTAHKIKAYLDSERAFAASININEEGVDELFKAASTLRDSTETLLTTRTTPLLPSMKSISEKALSEALVILRHLN